MDPKLTDKEAKKNQLRSMTAPHNVCQKVAKMCERWDQTLCQDEFRKEYSYTKARAILVCTWKDILSWDIIFCVGILEHSGKKDFWGMKRKTESWELAHELRAQRLAGAQQMLVGWMTQEPANVSWVNNSKLMIEWRDALGRRCLVCKTWVNKYMSTGWLTQSDTDIYIHMCLQVIWAKV